MKNTAATLSASTPAIDSVPTRQWDRLSTAYTFAQAREESRRGQFAEIVAAVLFGGCVAVSVLQSGAASFALNRNEALEQVVARAVQKKAQQPAATETPALATSQPARATQARPL